MRTVNQVLMCFEFYCTEEIRLYQAAICSEIMHNRLTTTTSHFIQDKLKISIYLSLDKYKCIKLIKKFVFHILISYYEFTCCIENSVDPDQLASSKAS